MSKLIPFAGFFSQPLSFGGSIIPKNIDDYKSVLARKAVVAAVSPEDNLPPMTEKSTISTAKTPQHTQTAVAITERPRTAHETIRHVQQQMGLPPHGNSREVLKPLPTWSIIAGCCVMLTLWAAAQVCFALIEWGSIGLMICKFTVYMHLWYIIVTIATFLDSWIELPLKEHFVLYLTRIEGDIQWHPDAEKLDLAHMIEQSKTTKRPARELKKLLHSSTRSNHYDTQASSQQQAPQSTLVVITTQRDEGDFYFHPRKIFQILVKCLQVFICLYFTALFSSVALLPQPMVQDTMIVFLGAGLLGGRYVVEFIVSAVYLRAPMIHVLAKDEVEASHVAQAIFELDENSTGGHRGQRKSQIETSGWIFLDRRLVAKRSPLWRAVFGVLAPS